MNTASTSVGLGWAEEGEGEERAGGMMVGNDGGHAVSDQTPGEAEEDAHPTSPPSTIHIYERISAQRYQQTAATTLPSSVLAGTIRTLNHSEPVGPFFKDQTRDVILEPPRPGAAAHHHDTRNSSTSTMTATARTASGTAAGAALLTDDDAVIDIPMAEAMPVTASQLGREERQQLERRNRELQSELDRHHRQAAAVVATVNDDQQQQHQQQSPPVPVVSTGITTTSNGSSRQAMNKRWVKMVAVVAVLLLVGANAVVYCVVGTSGKCRDGGQKQQKTIATAAAPTAATPPAAGATLNASATAITITTPMTTPTLLSWIKNTTECSTFSVALEAAGRNRNSLSPSLTNLLEHRWLTAFVPTNEAFIELESIMPGYLEQLLRPPFSLHLFQILSYHLTNGIWKSGIPVSDLDMLMSSGSINITASGMIQSATGGSSQTVLNPQAFQATNGIAYVIGGVLLPKFVGRNIWTTLEASPSNFGILMGLIEAAGLTDTIAGLTGVTFLAPTAIPPETYEYLLAAGNEDILKAVMRYHIIDTVVNHVLEPVPNILVVQTLQGENIVVGLIFGDEDVVVSFNQAIRLGERLTQQNIIYDVNTILVPPNLSLLVPAS